MKQAITLVGILLLNISVSAQKTIKVLFIGNSYTYVNNLPQTVHDIALANGDTLIFDSSAPGGYTFNMQSTYAPTLTKIAQGGWDYVVLQDQSEEPSFPPSQVQTDVYPYATLLDSLIHAADSCTETVFYMTWGHQNGDPPNCAGYPQICTYAGMQDRLSESYLEMGQMNHATVSPAGEAWRKIVAQPHAFDLYQADSSHPTVFGTYLTASVFYEILFQKSVLNTTFVTAGIPDSNARQLRHAAHSTVSDSLRQWLGYGHIPLASFTHQASGGHVSFTSTSLNGAIFWWSYGDGHTGSGASVSHTYASSGTYHITLTVSQKCKTSIYTDTVSVTVPSGLHSDQESDIRLFPSPASSQVEVDMGSVDISGGCNLFLTDVLGRKLKEQTIRSSSVLINVADLSQGVYWMVFDLSGHHYTRQVVIAGH
jgi:hypothetical protein